MKTIVEITDINGSKERGIVHQVKDLTFAKNCKQTLKIEIVQKGDNAQQVADFLNPINKTTANKINRLFSKFVDSLNNADKNESKSEDYSLEYSYRKEAKKEAAKFRKIEVKKEKELSEYLISKNIIKDNIFTQHLTEKNKYKFDDLECTLIDALHTLWLHIEYA